MKRTGLVGFLLAVLLLLGTTPTTAIQNKCTYSATCEGGTYSSGGTCYRYTWCVIVFPDCTVDGWEVYDLPC